MQNLNIKLFGLFFILQFSGCVTPPDNHVGRSAPATASPARPSDTGDFGAACSATVLRPALFRAEEKKVLVFDSSPDFTNIPAEIEWHSFRVQVEPARFPNETVPAEYEETTQIIATERERIELYTTPATYGTLTRRILVKDAYQRWKPGCMAGEADKAARKENTDCVEAVPAEYKEIKVEMVDTPAHTDQRRVPGKTLALKVRKLIKPGKGTGVPVPARYETVKVARVAKPWQIQVRQIPSRYETLEVQRKLRPERVLTSAAVCPDALTAEQVGRIQEQLLKNGHTLKPTQQLDATTWQAILKFQQDNGLDTGAITPQTLIKLGLT